MGGLRWEVLGGERGEPFRWEERAGLRAGLRGEEGGGGLGGSGEGLGGRSKVGGLRWEGGRGKVGKRGGGGAWVGGACGRGRTATNRTRRNKSNTTPHKTAEVLVSTEPPDDNPAKARGIGGFLEICSGRLLGHGLNWKSVRDQRAAI